MTIHPETNRLCPCCGQPIVQATFPTGTYWVHCGTFTATCYQATTDPNTR
jgi:hypothetical protein